MKFCPTRDEQQSGSGIFCIKCGKEFSENSRIFPSELPARSRTKSDYGIIGKNSDETFLAFLPYSSRSASRPV
jgi:hypothetical protein